jgi:hypothetical protein
VARNQQANLSESEVEAFVIEHITAQVGFEGRLNRTSLDCLGASMYFHPKHGCAVKC